MTDTLAILENLTPSGIAGIALIFIAIFMLVSICSWAITKYAKSKKNTINQKNEISTSKITKERVQTK